MNTNFEKARRFGAASAKIASIVPVSVAVAVIATVLPAMAHAEYRCASPGLLTLPERRACELARQDTPDELLRYVKMRRWIYGLYIYDYVAEADGTRWERNQAALKASQPVAKTNGSEADLNKVN